MRSLDLPGTFKPCMLIKKPPGASVDFTLQISNLVLV